MIPSLFFQFGLARCSKPDWKKREVLVWDGFYSGGRFRLRSAAADLALGSETSPINDIRKQFLSGLNCLRRITRWRLTQQHQEQTLAEIHAIRCANLGCGDSNEPNGESIGGAGCARKGA